jgi:putative ABC transport system ATP-binding protein
MGADASRPGSDRPAGGGPAAVEVRGVTKTFGAGDAATRALQGVDLRVERGELVAIMGPSGCGKSTLLNIVGALEPATSGSVVVDGLDYADADDRRLTALRREHIGFVFQFFNLLTSLTALENVLLPALIAGRRDAATLERARALLHRVGLGDRAEHLPTELSGGQQQRVSIARALLLEPGLLLADEPTGNLDSRAGAEVLRLLREVNREDGQTILMVTHDPGAAALAARVVFLRDGRVVDTVAGGDAAQVIEAFGRLAPAAEVG